MIITAEKERKSNPKASNAELANKNPKKSNENPPPKDENVCFSLSTLHVSMHLFYLSKGGIEVLRD